MNRRQQIGLACAALALLAGLLVWATRPREPVYQGKRLREWLEQFDRKAANEDVYAAREAVRQMGTNTLPFLLAMLRERDSSLKLRLVRLANSQKVFKLRILTAYDRRAWVTAAFEALGTQAKPAIPELRSLISNDVFASHAVRCLVATGVEAIPSLVLALESPGASARALAAEELGNYHVAAEIAVPALVKRVNDNDAQVRMRVAEALGKIKRQPEIAIPALVSFLRDRDATVRQHAAQALGRAKLQADVSVPALFAALEDPDSGVRHMTIFALSQFGKDARQAVPALVGAVNSPASPTNRALLDVDKRKDQQILKLLLENERKKAEAK